MECLKRQINVLRVIALWRPNAHIAFCYHAPYRNLYNNEGEVYNLVCAYGIWRSRFPNVYIYVNILRNTRNAFGDMNPLLPSYFIFNSAHEVHVEYDINCTVNISRNVTKNEFVPKNIWSMRVVDYLPKKCSKFETYYDYKSFLQKWTKFYQLIYTGKHFSYTTMKPFFIDQIDSNDI